MRNWITANIFVKLCTFTYAEYKNVCIDTVRHDVIITGDFSSIIAKRGEMLDLYCDCHLCLEIFTHICLEVYNHL